MNPIIPLKLFHQSHIPPLNIIKIITNSKQNLHVQMQIKKNNFSIFPLLNRHDNLSVLKRTINVHLHRPSILTKNDKQNINNGHHANNKLYTPQIYNLQQKTFQKLTSPTKTFPIPRVNPPLFMLN